MSRLMLTLACALAVLEFVLFAMNFRSPVGPQILVILPQLALFGIVVLLSFRAWRSCRDAGGRRFWRTIWFAIAVGWGGQIVDIRSFAHGPTPPAGLLQMIYGVLPFVLMMV